MMFIYFMCMIELFHYELKGEKITDENYVITEDVLLYNKYLIIRKGKKKYFIGK